MSATDLGFVRDLGQGVRQQPLLVPAQPPRQLTAAVAFSTGIAAAVSGALGLEDLHFQHRRLHNHGSAKGRVDGGGEWPAARLSFC